MQKESRRLAYIAKDTKTYMNIEEARFKYSKKGDKNILFILIPKFILNNLEERMRETVKREHWEEIIWIQTWSNGVSSGQKSKKRKSRLYKYFWDTKEFLYNYLDRRKLDAIAKKYVDCELVFSAHKNTQEHLAAKLKPAELVLVDSGHRIFDRMNDDGYIDYSRWFIAHSRFTRYMYWFTGFKVFDRKRTTLFTVYADEIETNHKVVKNNFGYQSHLLKSKELGDEVVWISTPIYAMVKEGVRIEDYASYISTYVDYLGIERDKLIYIPHPGKQTQDEIEFIRQKLNCRIDDRDIPVEFKIANYKNLPRLCVSPFSSALVNVFIASGGRIDTVSAWHCEFSHFEIWLNWRKDVEKNQKLNIQFLDLDECNSLFNIGKPSNHENPIYKTFGDWEKEKGF